MNLLALLTQGPPNADGDREDHAHHVLIDFATRLRVEGLHGSDMYVRQVVCSFPQIPALGPRPAGSRTPWARPGPRYASISIATLALVIMGLMESPLVILWSTRSNLVVDSISMVPFKHL